jgi:quercetin dioxygenase-like cupin family protein
MNRAKSFDAGTQTIAIDRGLSARTMPARPDPPMRVDGYTFGVATMTENSPHDGEMHPDGDEVLYLIDGKVRVTIESDPVQVLEMSPGDGMIVPQGVWHKVDILEPSRIIYLTPGPGGEYRPLPDDS